MTKVQQYSGSVFPLPCQDATSNPPITAPATGLPKPLNLGTSHVNPLVEKGAAARSVSIHTCGGKMFSMDLGPSTTVEQLKFEVQRQTGYLAKTIDLVFGSQSLHKGFDLGRLNAKASLVLVHKVHGG